MDNADVYILYILFGQKLNLNFIRWKWKTEQLYWNMSPESGISDGLSETYTHGILQMLVKWHKVHVLNNKTVAIDSAVQLVLAQIHYIHSWIIGQIKSIFVSTCSFI